MKAILKSPSKLLALLAVVGIGMPMLAYAVNDLVLNIGSDNKADLPGSAAIGTANSVGERSLAVGFNNHLDGANCAAVGEGLVVRADNGVALGSFNATAGRSAEAVFVVGTGDSETRNNALEVHPNGDVLLGRPQGDIPLYDPNQ